MSKLPQKIGGRPPDPHAAYLRLADCFREDIRAGVWPAGEAIPTLRALATRHRVGQQTVRMAIDVLKAEARIAPTGRRRWIVGRPKGDGLRSSDFALMIVALGLQSALKNTGTRALLDGLRAGLADVECPYLCMPQYALRNHLPSPQILGLPLKGVLLAGQIRPGVLRQWEKLKVPCVLVDRPRHDWRRHRVAADNEAAAYEATLRLIDRNRRRVAFVRRVQLNLRDIDEDARERETGWRRALKDAGLPCATEQVFNMFSKDTPESAWLKTLLTAVPRFDAVLTTDPGCASLLASAATRYDQKVGDDFEIFSFQGWPEKGQEVAFEGPAFDLYEMGYRAAQLLNEPHTPAQSLRQPFAWVALGTTPR